MSKTAVLLAGQGAFRPGMFAGERSSAELDRLLDTADATAAEFGRPSVRDHLLDSATPAAAELVTADPFTLQLLVFTAAVGEYHLAARAGTPDVLVGHSLGELAALTVAGAFDLIDSFRLVCHRSVALAECATEPGGMLSMDLPADRTGFVVAAVGDRRARVAVLNAPARTVVAGPDSVLEVVRGVAGALGVRAVRLPAPYAYHSPGMALAAEQFAEDVKSVRQRPLRLPVYSPLLRGYVDDSDDLGALLVQHLTTQVDFVAAIRALHAEGVRTVVECGHSGLGKLVGDCVPSVRVVSSAETPESKNTPAALAAPVPLAATASSVAEVAERLRLLYATVLQYPLEAVEPEADLEADLGIDSLKQAEMLGRVRAEFGLPAAAGDGRLIAHATLAELAGTVTAILTAEDVTR
ncbi:acyltransferase domain-containing protein [Amycolatopsis sp. DG1A-15b]|uniref:acyltransferase domain-containing protein n=1 Tax=Amycolatopsis sp. DG1A-15b TaxID=3052846 RepID=UPI00255BF274|nr:acyltransferase domain-containing protein [Amycolatopsis sp. DG1A-15b]WIX92944.1 acyltransferase domain-containing protein [Amycolatopsis sp. DG1A-15b]